jgi:hypothetical protein
MRCALARRDAPRYLASHIARVARAAIEERREEWREREEEERASRRCYGRRLHLDYQPSLERMLKPVSRIAC